MIEFSCDLLLNDLRKSTPAVHRFCWGGEIGEGGWDEYEVVMNRRIGRRNLEGVMV